MVLLTVHPIIRSYNKQKQLSTSWTLLKYMEAYNSRMEFTTSVKFIWMFQWVLWDVFTSNILGGGVTSYNEGLLEVSDMGCIRNSIKTWLFTFLPLWSTCFCWWNAKGYKRILLLQSLGTSWKEFMCQKIYFVKPSSVHCNFCLTCQWVYGRCIWVYFLHTICRWSFTGWILDHWFRELWKLGSRKVSTNSWKV